MLVTSIEREEINADGLLALYRLRGQVELVFKRINRLRICAKAGVHVGERH